MTDTVAAGISSWTAPHPEWHTDSEWSATPST